MSSTRRRFIKGVAGSAASLPLFAIGKEGRPASNKINVAVVGAGGMGGYAFRRAASMENLVALCDVDFHRAGRALNKHADVPRFRDFRVMLDKMDKEIDAVAISTPDHTHFPIAMAAMERGKHVFVQKPLAHNIWQCRTLQKAAEKHGIVTQMGNQGHCMEGMRRIKEWVDAGVVGDVTEVITWTNRPIGPWFVPPKSFPPPVAEVPEKLDWDLWQGPAEPRPFSKDYVPTLWRGWWDYGCGSLGDIEEWFAAIKGGPAPGSPFDYAAPLTEMVLLGALAQRSGKSIEWDADNMKVKGQPELDKWIKEPVRKGWDYPTRSAVPTGPWPARSRRSAGP